MSKKPKARMICVEDPHEVYVTGLFIPDGATIPLPADVRRLLKEIDKVTEWGEVTRDLWSAIETYRNAEQRRRNKP